jgi:hypothetical protein
MATYVYPENFELDHIEADLIAPMRAQRLGLTLFPEQTTGAAEVRWDQMDNDFGLMQFRGYNNDPAHVQRLGQNTFVYQPGVYGEMIPVNEDELTRRAASTGNPAPIQIGDLIMSCDLQLTGRQFTRMEWLCWQAMQGTVQVQMQGPQGLYNGYSDTYTTQTYSAATPWATTATATPILDMQNVQQKSVGHSVNMGAGAKAYMNQVTANNMINNSNSADLGGRRSSFGATLNNVPDVANYFGSQNLPVPVVYDAGYQTIPLNGVNTAVSTYNFAKFIGNATVIFAGARMSGAPLGKFYYTRDASGFSGPRRYIHNTVNGADGLPAKMNGQITVSRGFNGGPGVHFPFSIVIGTM